MKSFRCTIGTGVLLLGAVAGPAGAAEFRQAAPGGEPNGVILTTPALGLPVKEKARLVIVQAFPDKRSVPVEVLFKDAAGKVLARRRGVVGPDRPVIEELDRASIRTWEAVLLQTEVRLGPVAPADGASCPLHLTLEVLPDDDGRGSAHACPGIDPCLGGLAGPGARGTVFPFCVSRPGKLSVQRQ